MLILFVPKISARKKTSKPTSSTYYPTLIPTPSPMTEPLSLSSPMTDKLTLAPRLPTYGPTSGPTSSTYYPTNTFHPTTTYQPTDYTTLSPMTTESPATALPTSSSPYSEPSHSPSFPPTPSLTAFPMASPMMMVSTAAPLSHPTQRDSGPKELFSKDVFLTTTISTMLPMNFSVVQVWQKVTTNQVINYWEFQSTKKVTNLSVETFLLSQDPPYVSPTKGRQLTKTFRSLKQKTQVKIDFRQSVSYQVLEGVSNYLTPDTICMEPFSNTALLAVYKKNLKDASDHFADVDAALSVQVMQTQLPALSQPKSLKSSPKATKSEYSKPVNDLKHPVSTIKKFTQTKPSERSSTKTAKGNLNNENEELDRDRKKAPNVGDKNAIKRSN